MEKTKREASFYSTSFICKEVPHTFCHGGRFPQPPAETAPAHKISDELSEQHAGYPCTVSLCASPCVCVCNPPGERLPFPCLLLSSYTICRTSLTLLPLVTPIAPRAHTYTPLPFRSSPRDFSITDKSHLVNKIGSQNDQLELWTLQHQRFIQRSRRISLRPLPASTAHRDCVVCQHKQYYLIYIGLIHECN